MVLTKAFKETVKDRITHDGSFRRALLSEAVQMLIEGDMSSGKSILRDYINATVGFEDLAMATQRPAKSLMRMFGTDGNPTASNLFAVIGVLQERTGVHLEVRASKQAA